MSSESSAPQHGCAVRPVRPLNRIVRLSLLSCVLTPFIAAPAPTYAQAAATGTITGRVINAATKEYLKNAQVELVGTGRSTITDASGEFRFSDVPAGSAKINIAYPGLDVSEQTVSVEAQKTTAQEFALISGVYGAGDQTIQLEAFTVKSAREGNAKAIVDQKQAFNIKTVIAADAFGDVAEGNVGEFLKFLPGISVDYADADVRSIRVRGLPPKYANFTIDGHSVATSSSSSIGNGRRFELEQVSLATLDTSEVNKSPTADMPASALAGNINVVSKSAFSQKGRVIKYSFQTTFNQYAFDLKKSPGWDDEDHYKALPGGLLEFSDTFLDGKLGVVTALYHSGSYAEQKIIIGGQAFDRNPNNNETETPIQNSWNFQYGLKPTFRDSVVVNLDYKITDNLVASLRTGYHYYDATFHNRNWLITADTTGIATASNYDANGSLIVSSLPGNRVSFTGNSQRNTTASATSTASNAQIQGSNSRKYGGTLILNPTIKWTQDNVTTVGSFSYSQSRNKYRDTEEGYFNTVVARMNGVSWAFSREGETGLAVTQLNTGTSNNNSIFDLANYTDAVTVRSDQRTSKDQFWSTRLDSEVNFDTWALPTKIKVGTDYRLNVRDITAFNPSWSVFTGAGGVNLANYTERVRADVDKGTFVTDVNGVTALLPNADKWKLYELFTQYNLDPLVAAGGTGSASSPFFVSAANAGGNLRSLLQNNFDIKETVQSAYAMSTIQVRKDLTALAGLRFEKTKTAGKGFDDIGNPDAVALSGTTNTNSPAYIYARYGRRIERTKSYDNFFPSLQLRYEPRRNLVLRAAYFSSILRPDFQNVVGGVSVNDVNGAPFTFTANNTELEPETANNFDVHVEYYFEPVGVLSFGVFKKDLKDIQIQVTQLIDPAAVPQAILDLGFTPSELGSNSTVSQRINAGDTSVTGAELNYSQELSFLPGVLRGFGVTANLSYVRPEEDRIFTLTSGGDGIPKYTANFILRYKLNKFSAQLSANWTDARVFGLTGVSINSLGQITVPAGSQTGTANVNRTEYTDSRTVYGLNLGYKLHRYASLFLNLNNFTNAPQFRYFDNERNISRHGSYGATINVGVKGSF